jgi:type I restriction enzyme S subunit
MIETWTTAKIEEIAEINPRLPKGALSGEMPVSFVPMAAVGARDGSIDVSDTRPYSAVQKGFTTFKESDVLFAKITPCMENGKMAVVPGVRSGYGFGSTEFHVLRPYTGVESDYLYFFVSSKQFRMDAEHNMTGAVGQRRVPTTYLAACEIPLPSSNEQKRIVAKIEELFSELDKGIESFKIARDQLKVYRQVLLNCAAKGELFGQRDNKTTRAEKATVSFSDVVLSVGQGWSPRCMEHPSENDDTWGVIRTSAIQPLNFVQTANKRLPDQLQPRPHLEIFPGDVLITRAGPRNRVGIACYVKSVRPRLMVCDKVYRIKVKQNKILPEYLVMLLNSPRVLEELEPLKSGISDSGLNLTQDRFLSLKVVLPSLATQKIILENLEQKLSNVAFFEAQLDGSLETSETLRQSILKKAFSGQLVPQDPDDEPATQLLERIKAEKAAQTKPAKQNAKTSKPGTKKD